MVVMVMMKRTPLTSMSSMVGRWRYTPWTPHSYSRTLVTVVTTCAVSASQHLSLPTPGSVRLRPGQPRPRLRLRLPPCWRPRWSRAARPRVRRAGLPQPTHEYTTNFKLAELRRGTWTNQSEDSIRTR